MTSVLFWNTGFWPGLGGLEVLTAELALEVAARGVDVHILAPEPGPGSYRGLPVHRIPSRDAEAYRSPEAIAERLLRPIREVKRTVKPDIVHLNGLEQIGWLHLFTQRAWPVPTVLTLHGAWGSEADKLAAQLFETVDRIAVCSEHIGRRVRSFAPHLAQRTVAAWNALPPPSEPVSQMPVEPTLLMLGRLAPEKGLDLGLEAYAILRQEFPDLRLVLAGEGALRAELERRVKGWEGVCFLGAVTREAVPATLNRATLVMMPSRVEGFGLTALEAAWMARPVVAAAVGGLPEVVLDGVTGLLVPPEDPRALAGAVGSLLRDPRRLEALGLEARRRVGRFGWEEYVQRYLDLYRELSA